MVIVSCFLKATMLVLLFLTLRPVSVSGAFVPEGGEYNITGMLPGEQIFPQVALTGSGGYVVWQDNITDGDEAGISARRLDASLAGTLSVFRVNQVATDLQERPAVAALKNGGAAFVWHGGKLGFQHIYGRFLSPTGWVSGDVLVSGATNSYQTEAAVTTLTNGNVVVVWSSINQASGTSLKDIYFQMLTSSGQKVGGETIINQTIAYNQRSAAVTALHDGRFVVVWISEQQRFENSVDVFARFYSAAGGPIGGEFLISSSTNACANPTVAPAQDGGFMVTWMERGAPDVINIWDIYARPVGSAGALGAVRRVNAWTVGDQLAPKIAGLGGEYLVSWTSMAQDGDGYGVYGRFLGSDGALKGDEFRVTTTTVANQMHPAIASDESARFVAVWTSFVGSPGSYDLYAQRYVTDLQPLAAPSAPFVNVLSASTLSVSWPAVEGLNVGSYEVYADGAVTATATVSNTYWNSSGLAAASTHSYRLAYVLVDGRRSPLSPVATATTYSAGTYFGIPFEWMAQFNWGQGWPPVTADSDGDGMSNYKEFLAGTNPLDANSVLKVRLEATTHGLFLNWNSQPGQMYQVWSASTPTGPWVKVGNPRFAAGAVDSLYVGGNSASFYQIERLR